MFLWGKKSLVFRNILYAQFCILQFLLSCCQAISLKTALSFYKEIAVCKYLELSLKPFRNQEHLFPKCFMRPVAAHGRGRLWIPEEEADDSREGQVWGPACMPGVWLAYEGNGSSRPLDVGSVQPIRVNCLQLSFLSNLTVVFLFLLFIF